MAPIAESRDGRRPGRRVAFDDPGTKLGFLAEIRRATGPTQVHNWMRAEQYRARRDAILAEFPGLSCEEYFGPFGGLWGLPRRLEKDIGSAIVGGRTSMRLPPWAVLPLNGTPWERAEEYRAELLKQMKREGLFAIPTGPWAEEP